MQYINLPLQQRCDFICHLGRISQAMGLSLCQRIRAVDALPVASAFGLHADLPAAAKVDSVVHEIAFGGRADVFRPCGRVCVNCAVASVD